jgi:glycerol uptake facilitator-like aquaporin
LDARLLLRRRRGDTEQGIAPDPAATIARSLSNTFAGIAPASVPMFVLAELAGALLGLGVVVLLYPRRGAKTR